MAAGLISESQFIRAVEEVASKSKLIEDEWSIKKAGERVYLEKTIIRNIAIKVPDDDYTDLMEENVEETDLASLDTKGDNCTCSITFVYHVLYSESYSVPVLFFNALYPDGRLLPLDEVWNLVPQHYQERLQGDRWTFITQQEHPYLGRPFYQLHPCHTEALMSQAEAIDQSKSSNYLITWLSAVGPVVLLEVPMTYAVDDGD